MANIIEILIKANDQASKEIDKVTKSTDEAAKSQERMAKISKVASAAVVAGIGLAVTALGASVKAAMEAEEIQSQLEAVLKSTGGQAGMTADSINDMAMELSRMTGIEDDSIVKSSALLLTFTRIHKDTFPKAQKAILNMSVAMGQDLQSATIQVGKALNDPILGITALSRVGVQLTEDQKKLIKSMVEVGDVAGAQAVILGELETQFGGVAEAAGETLEGKMNKAKNAIGNLGETIGAKLIPVLGDAAQGLTSLIEGPQKVGNALDDLNVNIANGSQTYEDYIQAMGKTRQEMGFVGGFLKNLTEDEFKHQKQILAVEKAHGEWDRAMNQTSDTLDYLIKTGIIPGTTATNEFEGAIGDLEGQILTADAAMQNYSEKLLFNMAAQNMDAEAALSLAEELGLVDQRTVAAYEAVQIATEKFDRNEDQIIDSTEAATGFNEEIGKIGAYLDSVPKDIEVRFNVVVTGDPIPTGPRPGEGGGNIPVQVGGWVTAGQRYLVGEQGPEPFTPNVSGVVTPNHVTHNWNMTINEAGRVVDPLMSFAMLKSLAGA